MKLDRTLTREIKALNGNGTRENRFETLKKVRNASQDFSTPKVRECFNDYLKKHGRAITAICLASTIYNRRERLGEWELKWALAILNLWTNKLPSFIDRANIEDGLHPTRICEYAESFINLTKEE